MDIKLATKYYSLCIGGDEFCCLLPEVDNHTINLVAERIHNAIESHLLLRRHTIFCSIGITTYQKHDTQIDVFLRADKTLYSAKKAGENCIRLA